MRICIIGKYPPIQGGVSMRTYWTAHGLAARGHDVHVVTNAKEVRPPFRMHMRAADWARCEADYGVGSVAVHWSDPADRAQAYIPMASAFVSKLAGIATHLHAERPFDVIFSHYLEPYGVAGHLAGQITGTPHVVRTAGSDAGRLWRHPQVAALYDHVLRSADAVVATGPVAERAQQRGVDPARIVFGGAFAVPEDLFAPDGPMLDFAALRAEVEADADLRPMIWGEFAADRPYFGICGKLGASKGSFALLAALQKIRHAGLDVGLVALAQGEPDTQRRFRNQARRLGLSDRILQIPFLPHWRVPEFLRGCLAVCCLEQDFPISFHAPIIPREVLMCGTCLVASTEVIRKLPAHGRLPDAYGCVAIEDVNDVEALAARLAAIVRDPQPAAAVGARGRAFAQHSQRNTVFPEALERILATAAARGTVPAGRGSAAVPDNSGNDRFRLTEIAAGAVRHRCQGPDRGSVAAPSVRIDDPDQAREVLTALQRNRDEDRARLHGLAQAVETELAIAAAEDSAEPSHAAPASDPLFRLRMRRWAMGKDDLAGLIPERAPGVRILAFDFDVAEFIGARTPDELSAARAPRRSYLVAFARTGNRRRAPHVVDALTMRALELCDGTMPVSQLIEELGPGSGPWAQSDLAGWIEHLFVQGLISLRDPGWLP